MAMPAFYTHFTSIHPLTAKVVGRQPNRFAPRAVRPLLLRQPFLQGFLKRLNQLAQPAIIRRNHPSPLACPLAEGVGTQVSVTRSIQPSAAAQYSLSECGGLECDWLGSQSKCQGTHSGRLPASCGRSGLQTLSQPFRYRQLRIATERYQPHEHRSKSMWQPEAVAIGRNQ